MLILNHLTVVELLECARLLLLQLWYCLTSQHALGCTLVAVARSNSVVLQIVLPYTREYRITTNKGKAKPYLKQEKATGIYSLVLDEYGIVSTDNSKGGSMYH